MSKCSTCNKRLVSTAVAVVGTNLQITIPEEPALVPDTKYCLLIAQPVPEAGENLPVTILVTGGTAVQLLKTMDKIKGCGCPQCTFGDVEYGCDLPDCGRTRIPVFYSNAELFFDLRGVEKYCYCK